PMPTSLLSALVTRATCSRGLIELKCRGGVMGIIMIKCPVTGRDVSRGIETMGIEELPAVTAKMVCPACGRVHDWITTNAWLAPQRRAVPARSDACEPSADDVDIARPFTGSLNLHTSAFGRGFHRARACRRFGNVTSSAAARCGYRAWAPSSLADIVSWRRRR